MRPVHPTCQATLHCISTLVHMAAHTLNTTCAWLQHLEPCSRPHAPACCAQALVADASGGCVYLKRSGAPTYYTPDFATYLTTATTSPTVPSAAPAGEQCILACVRQLP
jgi:hypothetical protein